MTIPSAITHPGVGCCRDGGTVYLVSPASMAGHRPPHHLRGTLLAICGDGVHDAAARCPGAVRALPTPGIAHLSGQRDDRDHAHAVRQSMGSGEGMMAVSVGVPGLTGRSDVRLVSARLRDVPDALSVEVDAAAGVVVVRGSVDATAVRAALLEVGYLPGPLTG